MLLIFTCCRAIETETSKSVQIFGERKGEKLPSGFAAPISADPTRASIEVVLYDTVKANEFFAKALIGTMMAIEMGRLAQANSQDEAVRVYGQTLEQDHSMLQRLLMTIGREEEFAVTQNIDTEMARRIEQLRQLKGKAFDLPFLQMIISDHTRYLAEYRTASSYNQSAKIKQFAMDGIPVLEKHLAKAQELIQRKENN